MIEYVTVEAVEKTAQALHDRRSMECGALHEFGQPLGDTVYDNDRRADARAALTAAAPLIAAKALRDFASASNTSEFHIEVLLGGSDYVRQVLRDRADQIEAGR